MTVLVTGASGFVGRHVVRALASRGLLTRALVHERPLNADAPVEVIRGDLRVPESLKAACADVECVVHLASIIADDDATCEITNVRGTKNLLAACGEEGTFARVAGCAKDEVSAIATALDSGGIPAGFVGFSADGARVHLAEADELRTHAWPGLEELSSVELADDFVSSFAGAVLGESLYIDGQDAESNDDQVMKFDRSAIVGSVLSGDVPNGMWAGRLGGDALVTVESKGDPARGRVFRVT